MENLIGKHGDIKPELFITTSLHKPVNVSITSPGLPNSQLNQKFTITNGHVKLVQIDPSYRLTKTELSKKGIYIKADGEIVVYGVNREIHSDDAYLALPLDVLGTEYYTISYTPAYYYTLFAVIGTENQTNVAIHLPNRRALNITLNGVSYTGNQWINLTMDRYSTLELHSVPDLTGTHIISDKPIGVLSGNKKTIVGNTGGSRDHLVEMLLPVSSWGKNFATVPIPERQGIGDIFRFVASEDNTRVNVTYKVHGKIVNNHFIIRHAGGFIQKHYNSSMYAHIKSNKPMAVYQFSLTQVQSHNHQTGSDEADPSMIMIPPIEQYATDYTFTTPEYSLGNYTNYFMFVVDGRQKDGLRLDRHHLPKTTKYHHIPGSHLVAGYVPVSVGTHHVSHTNGSVVIGGMLFGKARLESYGFPVGLLMKTINAVSIFC